MIDVANNMPSQNQTRVPPSGRTYSHTLATLQQTITTMPTMIFWCQPDESEVFNLQTGISDELDNNSVASLRVMPRSWSEDETDSVSSSTTSRRVGTHLSPHQSNSSSSNIDVLQERRPKVDRNPLQDITCRTLNSRKMRSINNNSNRR